MGTFTSFLGMGMRQIMEEHLLRMMLLGMKFHPIRQQQMHVIFNWPVVSWMVR